VEITIEVKWVRGSYILHEKPGFYYHELNINPDVLLFCEHLGTQPAILDTRIISKRHKVMLKYVSFAQKFWSLDTCADETIVLTIGWMFIASQRILRLLVVIIKYSSQAILLKSGWLIKGWYGMLE
jgi:hypothetical protein